MILANKAYSQTNVSDTLSIDIKNAEKIFIDKNLSLLAAKYNVDANAMLVNQAQKWDNPILMLDQNIYNHVTKKYFDATNSGQTYGQVQQLIKLGGKRKAAVAIAKDNLEIAKLQLDDLLRNLRYTLHTDLYNAANFLQAEKLFADEINEMQKLTFAIGEQVKVGNAAMKDLLRVQAELFSVQNDALQNQKQLVAVEAEIRQLLLLPENAFVKPAVSDSLQNNLVEKINVADLFNEAKNNRPDYKIQQTQTLQQQHNLNLQRASEVPDLTVGTEYDHNSNYISDYWGLTLAMPLPILNTNRNNVKAAKNYLSEQQQNELQFEKNIATDVSSAYIKLKNTIALNSSVNETLGTKYDLMMRNMIQNYQQRNISLLELMDFFDTYKDAKLKALQLLNDSHNAVEDLNLSVGKQVIGQ
jgi:cobalt-zinc-cadmium efflux system outer membrane protein